MLLETTKKELNFIVSCILQVDLNTASKYTSRAGTAVAAKMAGAGVSAGLYGLVSTFGTASTGTAIAGLSGAAQTNATLYWFGSWVGGGVAWGTTIVSGIGIAVAVVAYPLLKSRPRDEATLTDIDSVIINNAVAYVGQIDVTLAQDAEPSNTEMSQLSRLVITPFYQELQRNIEDIASRLDTKNAFALQVQADPRFKRKVVDPFAQIA